MPLNQHNYDTPDIVDTKLDRDNRTSKTKALSSVIGSYSIGLSIKKYIYWDFHSKATRKIKQQKCGEITKLPQFINRLKLE